MTTTPANLRVVRELFQKHTGLKANALGIAPDKLHDGGYHCGEDRVRRDGKTIRDYSVNESARDRNGLTLDAAAIDIGDYTITVKGKRYGLDHLNAWLVAQCRANAPDARDIREVIYRTDAKTVKRWDRLGIRSSGDSSHLWHTHVSYHRDAIKAGRNLVGLYERYFQHIGLLAGKDDDMAALTDAQAKQLANVERMLGKLLKGGLGPDPNGRPDNAATFHLRSILDAEDPLLGENFPGWQPLSPAGLKQLSAQLDALHAELDALKRQAPEQELDYDRLAAALLRGIAGQA